MRLFRLLIALLTFLSVPAVFTARLNAQEVATEAPTPQQRVTDKAGVLDGTTKHYLEAKLADLEHRTGIQFVIYVDQSLNGVPIEDFANQSFRAWGVGQKDKNNGLAYFLFTKDRQGRFEVGYGLESTLTDGVTKVIQAQTMRPAYIKGDWNTGLRNGVDAVLARLGEVPAAAGEKAAPDTGKGETLFLLFYLLVGLALVAWVVASQRKESSGLFSGPMDVPDLPRGDSLATGVLIGTALSRRQGSMSSNRESSSRRRDDDSGSSGWGGGSIGSGGDSGSSDWGGAAAATAAPPSTSGGGLWRWRLQR